MPTNLNPQSIGVVLCLNTELHQLQVWIKCFPLDLPMQSVAYDIYILLLLGDIMNYAYDRA